MPTYSYFCNLCKKKFEIYCSIKQYKEKCPCSGCGKKDTHRLYTDDLSTLHTSIKKTDSELKTIGDIANRNRDRMSEDEKLSMRTKHNDYKDQESTKSLPTGMSRMKKPKTKPKWT